jgi:uncharacterized membrane protein (DUF485 family)
MAKSYRPEDYENLNEQVKKIDRNLTLIVVVLFIGFITMLVGFLTLVIDANGEKHASYEDLKNQVQSQNDKIDQLIQKQ